MKALRHEWISGKRKSSLSFSDDAKSPETSMDGADSLSRLAQLSNACASSSDRIRKGTFEHPSSRKNTLEARLPIRLSSIKIHDARSSIASIASIASVGSITSVTSLQSTTSVLSTPSAMSVASHFSRDFDFEELDGLNVERVLDDLDRKETIMMKKLWTKQLRTTRNLKRKRLSSKQ